MIEISKERRDQAFRTLEETALKKMGGEMPAEYRDFLNLAETETVEMPPVEGFGWKVYVVRAKNRGANCPVHINVHGGGFFAPHMENDSLWSAWLAHQIGGVVVDVDYTTTKEAAWPVCFDQCYMAAQWTVAHCGELGGDPQRVSMGGYSAGAHLTAGVCIKAAETGDFKLALQVMGYPALDLKTHPLYKAEGYDYVISPPRGEAFNILLFNNDPVLAESPYLSPFYASDEILSLVPPAVMLSAGHCNFRFENEAFATRLASLGVEVTMKRYPEAYHGFIPHLMEGWQEAGRVIARQIRTIRQEA